MNSSLFKLLWQHPNRARLETPQEVWIREADEQWDRLREEDAPYGNVFFAYKCILAAHKLVQGVYDILPEDSEHRLQLEYILSWLPLDESVARDGCRPTFVKGGFPRELFNSRHPSCELDELGSQLPRAMEALRDAYFSPGLDGVAKATLAAAYVFAAEAQVEKARCHLHPFGPAAEQAAASGLAARAANVYATPTTRRSRPRPRRTCAWFR